MCAPAPRGPKQQAVGGLEVPVGDAALRPVAVRLCTTFHDLSSPQQFTPSVIDDNDDDDDDGVPVTPLTTAA